MGGSKRRRILPHARPGQHEAVELEVGHHVEERIDRLVAAGWSREEAEAEAWRRFGDPEAVKDELLAVGAGGGWTARVGRIRALPFEAGRDVRLAARALLRRPVFTGAAVLTLGLAIGGNATVFSVVDATLLRPLPYPHADRLMRAFIVAPDLARGEGATREVSWSYPKYELLRERQGVFEAVSVFRTNWFAVTGDAGARHVDGEIVSEDYLPMLGVEPVLGRNFLPEENATPGTHYVALVSHDLWSLRFGGDPDILGTEILLHDQLLGGGPRSHRVVGVLPRGFGGLTGGADVWVPLMTRPPGQRENPATHNKWVLGRLRAGVDPIRARAEIAEIGRAIHEVYPARGERADEWSADAVLLSEERMAPAIRRAVLLTFGAVGCLLLIACVNVTNLLLARASTRRREVAIRKALGAGNGHLVRHLLVESGLLAGAGAGLGLLISYGGVTVVRELAPVAVGAANEGFFRGALAGLTDQGLGSIRFDASVTLFGVALALLSVLLVGLLPALYTARGDLTRTLRRGGHGASGPDHPRGLPGRSALVAVEVAFTFALLTASALMLRSVDRLLGQDPGFATDGVLAAELMLSWDYEPAGLAGFYSSLDGSLAALPGVEAAGRGSCVPLAASFGCGTTSGGTAASILGDGERGTGEVAMGIVVADPGYFAALRIPLLRGRGFSDVDGGASAKVALVSEAAARRYWPSGSPLGARLGVSDDTVEVVGVVADVKYESLAVEPDPLLYLPAAQVRPAYHGYLVVRSPVEPGRLASAIRATVAGIDPDLPVMNLRTLAGRVSEATSTTRFTSRFLAVFALVGLILATVGIYGVVAFGVVRRRHEIGIRVALGARRADVAGMVLGRGVWMAGSGVLAGLGIVYAARGLLRGVLYGVEPFDAWTLVGTAVLLASVALLASWVPARRAMSVDPVTTLRAD